MNKIPIISVLSICGAVQPGLPDGGAVQVRLETSHGNVILELDSTAAPKTVDNFLLYVREGFYDGTIFHRVIKGFMIQGGGYTERMDGKPGHAPVINEAENGLKNCRGTIAMARTMDPHSASAQFFVNSVDNDFLDHTAKTQDGWGYCVFGKVVEGMEVVDAIERVPTTSRAGHQDVPVSPVTIKRATVVDL